jgi:hypothetical protein
MLELSEHVRRMDRPSLTLLVAPRMRVLNYFITLGRPVRLGRSIIAG